MKKYWPSQLKPGDSFDYDGARFIVISTHQRPFNFWEVVVTNRLMGGTKSVWLKTTEQVVDEHYDEVTKAPSQGR